MTDTDTVTISREDLETLTYCITTDHITYHIPAGPRECNYCGACAQKAEEIKHTRGCAGVLAWRLRQIHALE